METCKNVGISSVTSAVVLSRSLLVLCEYCLGINEVIEMMRYSKKFIPFILLSKSNFIGMSCDFLLAKFLMLL